MDIGTSCLKPTIDINHSYSYTKLICHAFTQFSILISTTHRVAVLFYQVEKCEAFHPLSQVNLVSFLVFPSWNFIPRNRVECNEIMFLISKRSLNHISMKLGWQENNWIYEWKIERGKNSFSLVEFFSYNSVDDDDENKKIHMVKFIILIWVIIE